MESKLKDSPIKKPSKQGRQTLFRVTFRTQVSLIGIADNKANIVMGINAMIITVLIGIISSRMISSSEKMEENLVLGIPILLILLTSLFTALYAIRAAQPRFIRAHKAKNEGDKKASLLFFENIWQLTTDDYIEKMGKVLDSTDDIYENMLIDIHNQAKVLHRKYRLLHYAYRIFMFGFIISISSFLLLWITVY